MTTTKGQSREAAGAESGSVDLKFEVVVVPVSDVDRSKEFYEKLGWRLDADFPHDNGFRIVQFTPPGSGCSVQFGSNMTSAVPGSASGLYLIVSDIEAAREELAKNGAKVSDVFHPGTPGAQSNPTARAAAASGAAPGHASYGSFATFADPDGNSWLLQEVTDRLPGRVDPSVTSFTSTSDLPVPSGGHRLPDGEHEKRIGQPITNWPDWYADYMVRDNRYGNPPQ